MSQPFILALDISKSCTGIAMGRAGETPRFLSIKGKDLDDCEACGRFGGWLADITRVERVDYVYYEAPIRNSTGDRHHTNANAVEDTFEMMGVLKAFLWHRGIRPIPVHVNTARKAFLGRGNLTGAVAKSAAKLMSEHLGWSPQNLDQADAAAVWYLAVTRVAPRLAYPILPHDQARVLERAASPARRVSGGGAW